MAASDGTSMDDADDDDDARTVRRVISRRRARVKSNRWRRRSDAAEHIARRGVPFDVARQPSFFRVQILQIL